MSSASQASLKEASSLLSMLFGQAASTLLEQRLFRESEMVAEEGVDEESPSGPYSDVAGMAEARQAAKAESVLRVLRKAWQPLLMSGGIRGVSDDDDDDEEEEEELPVTADAARAVEVSRDIIVKYFIIFE